MIFQVIILKDLIGRNSYLPSNLGSVADGELKAATKDMANSIQESIGENKENQTMLMTAPAKKAVFKSNAATNIEGSIEVEKLFMEVPSSVVKDVSGKFKEGAQILLAEGSKTVLEEDIASGEAGPQLKGDLAKPKKEPIRRVPRSVPAGFQATPAAKGTKVQPKTLTAIAASGRKTLPGPRTSLGSSIKLKPTTPAGRNSLPPLKTTASRTVQKEAGSANEPQKAIVEPTRVLRSEAKAGVQAITSAMKDNQAKNAAASVNQTKGLAKGTGLSIYNLFLNYSIENNFFKEKIYWVLVLSNNFT